MTDLANAVCAADAHSADAGRIRRNIAEWVDSLFAEVRKLLLLVEKRSHFTPDLIRWTERMVELFLELAAAPVCDDYHRQALRKHAIWLVSNFPFLPTDEEAVRFVENPRLAEHIFGVALTARRFGAPNVTDTCRTFLMNWALKAGEN